MEQKAATVFREMPGQDSGSIPPDSILSEALLQTAGVKVVRFRFAKGQELSEHTASTAAMMHQVSGRAVWGLGGETHDAEPGDWAYMEPNLKHSVHAKEDSVLLLLLLKKTGE